MAASDKRGKGRRSGERKAEVTVEVGGSEGGFFKKIEI